MADGSAVCAGIDHTIWADAVGGRTSVLQVVDRTRDWPAPPLVVRPDLDPGVRQVLYDVLAALDPIGRVAAFVPATSRTYEVMA